MKDISLYERVPSIENNFTVKFRVYNSRWLRAHWHEHVELLYFNRGGCEFFCDGKPFNVKEGDLVVVNSTEIHNFSVKEETEFFSFLLYPDFFSDIKYGGIILKNLVSGDTYVKECMSDIHSEHRLERVGSDMMIKSHTYRLMAYLVRNYTEDILTEKDIEQRNQQLKRIDNILEYITENYQDRITTKALADMSYVSEAYFCRFFKKAIGKSVTEYINEYRLSGIFRLFDW